jgi:hypothetical protein
MLKLIMQKVYDYVSSYEASCEKEMRVRDLPYLDDEEESVLCSNEFNPEQIYFELRDNSPEQKNLTKRFVYKTSIGYAVCGEEMGRGNWTRVHIGLVYNNADKDQLKKVVIKHPSPTAVNGLKNVFNNTVQTSLSTEAELMKKFYGFGEVIRIKGPNDKLTMISILPYLGEITLQVLLQNDALVKNISIKEWLNFFQFLIYQVIAFHRVTQRIHADIKPANIAISLIRRQGELVFSMINLIDFGNACFKNSVGNYGDIHYQSSATYIPSLRDEGTDYYALLTTFLEAVLIIKSKSLSLTDNEKNILRSCCKLFTQYKDAFNTPTGKVPTSFNFEKLLLEFLNMRVKYSPETILKSESDAASLSVSMNGGLPADGGARLITIEKSKLKQGVDTYEMITLATVPIALPQPKFAYSRPPSPVDEDQHRQNVAMLANIPPKTRARSTSAGRAPRKALVIPDIGRSLTRSGIVCSEGILITRANSPPFLTQSAKSQGAEDRIEHICPEDSCTKRRSSSEPSSSGTHRHSLLFHPSSSCGLDSQASEPVSSSGSTSSLLTRSSDISSNDALSLEPQEQYDESSSDGLGLVECNYGPVNRPHRSVERAHGPVERAHGPIHGPVERNHGPVERVGGDNFSKIASGPG